MVVPAARGPHAIGEYERRRGHDLALQDRVPLHDEQGGGLIPQTNSGWTASPAPRHLHLDPVPCRQREPVVVPSRDLPICRLRSEPPIGIQDCQRDDEPGKGQDAERTRQRSQRQRDDRGKQEQQAPACQLHGQRGASTCPNTRRIAESASSPSISDSGRRITRCRKTGATSAFTSSGETKSRPWRAAQVLDALNRSMLARRAAAQQEVAALAAGRARSR